MEVFLAAAGFLAAAAGGYAAGRARMPRTAPRDGASDPSAGPPPAAVDAALAATSTGVAILDRDDVVWANPAAHALRLVQDGAVAPALARVARKARREQVAGRADVEVAYGRESLSMRVVAAPAGALVAVLADDITEARRIDEIRRDFVANVSHELKTPVGAISLLAEALRDSGDDAEAVRQFAGRMVAESARLSRLVQELIDLSRLEGAEPLRTEPVRVRSFVDEAVDRARLAAEARGIDVAVHVDDPALVVDGDPAQLCTALSNLIDNAIAYSGPRAKVSVAARRRGGEVEVSVTDEGIGISPADQERVFERFYRVDPARSRETGGTGLGLAIVKHIAANHGGRVDVWSVEGTGSTFTLTLPAGAPAGLATKGA